ncbi:hypothetical protein PoB_000433600, partial [Plakobranchus ocellatus]
LSCIVLVSIEALVHRSRLHRSSRASLSSPSKLSCIALVSIEALVHRSRLHRSSRASLSSPSKLSCIALVSIEALVHVHRFRFGRSSRTRALLSFSSKFY